MLTSTDAEAKMFQNIYNDHKESMQRIITFDCKGCALDDIGCPINIA